MRPVILVIVAMSEINAGCRSRYTERLVAACHQAEAQLLDGQVRRLANRAILSASTLSEDRRTVADLQRRGTGGSEASLLNAGSAMQIGERRRAALTCQAEDQPQERPEE